MEKFPRPQELQNQQEKHKKGSKVRKAVGAGLLAGISAAAGALYEKGALEHPNIQKTSIESRTPVVKAVEEEAVEKLTVQKIKKEFFGDDLKFFGKDFDPVVGEEQTKSEGTEGKGDYKIYKYREDDHAAVLKKEWEEKNSDGEGFYTAYEANGFDKDHVAFGDINGTEAAAFIRSESGGGSGTFYSLDVVVNKNGVPEKVATIGLGDRSKIKSVKIEFGKIVVDYIGHGEGDSMAEPTEEEHEIFILSHSNGKYTLFEQVTPE